MECWQSHWSGDAPVPRPRFNPDLILAFGARPTLKRDIDALHAAFPDVHIVGCSGAGEIVGTQLHETGLALTAMRLRRARLHVVSRQLAEGDDGTAAGRALANALPEGPLAHVMVFSDGLHVNGTALVQGLSQGLPKDVTVTGGLAGDDARFETTLVSFDGNTEERTVVAIGFYGAIRVGFGSLGGWDPFGPVRTVTRSEGNVVYALDGQPALALYKRYLGEHAAGLPASGLLFPLHLPTADGGQGVVRTILAVDEEAGSLTFAGDVPEGARAQLMKANFDRLVEGAHTAANRSVLAQGTELAILISCVGRKLVLGQRTEDELHAVRETLGSDATMTGFYSYGEICPAAPDADCRLHNQTMTITTMRED